MVSSPPAQRYIMILNLGSSELCLSANSAVSLLVTLCSVPFCVLWFVLWLGSEPQICASPLQQLNVDWAPDLVPLPSQNYSIFSLEQYQAIGARSKLFLTVGDLGVLREIMVAGKFYILSPFSSQTCVIQVRMQELTCCQTAPSSAHLCQQSWIAT